eukprot:5365074-Prymnesium_polylepis.2
MCGSSLAAAEPKLNRAYGRAHPFNGWESALETCGDSWLNRTPTMNRYSNHESPQVSRAEFQPLKRWRRGRRRSGLRAPVRRVFIFTNLNIFHSPIPSRAATSQPASVAPPRWAGVWLPLRLRLPKRPRPAVGDDRLEGVAGSQPGIHRLVGARRASAVAAEPHSTLLDVLALVGVPVSGDHRVRHDFV